MPSASPAPIWCRAKSENGWNSALFRGARLDLAVRNRSVWHSTQPIPVLGAAPAVAGTTVPNSAWPRSAEAPSGWQVVWLVKASQGTGAAFSRIKIVKFSIREEIWLASSPALVPVGIITWVLSSGVVLVAHPLFVRSLVNNSLV